MGTIWRWRYETSDGVEVIGGEPAPETFTSQTDAESWLGENWRSLIESGVDQVSLLEDERVEYSGMSLHPPD